MRTLSLQADGLDAVATTTIAVLRAGGVVAAPTDTVYGLLTLWTNAAGRQRLYELKARPSDKLLQMMAADVATAERAGLLPDPRLAALGACFWPGPLTIVGHAAGGETIGLRIPQHAFILAVLRGLGVAVAATSANRSGEPAAAAAASAVAGLSGEPDLLVDGGPIVAAQASTVISLVEAEVRVLREGPISLAAIRAALPALNPEP